MSLAGRFFGVIVNPAATLRSLADHPVWLDALVVVLAAGAALSYLAFPDMQQNKLADLESRRVAFITAHGEAQYEAAVARVAGESRALRAFVINPLTMLTGFLFTSLIALAVGRAAYRRGHYLQVFSCLVHADFLVDVLGKTVRLLLIREPAGGLGAPPDLAALFPSLASHPIARAALGRVDPFSVWMYVLFGLGLAAVFKVGNGKGLAISFSLWLLRGLTAVGCTLAGLEIFF